LSEGKPEVADAKVVVHLVKLIQDSPDVRYYVGGWGTQMRELLAESLRARGHEQPLELLKPPPHRADDEPRVKMLERQLDELRAAARAHIEADSIADTCDARERLKELL
jgi:arginyl-tRNA synthetase